MSCSSPQVLLATLRLKLAQENTFLTRLDWSLRMLKFHSFGFCPKFARHLLRLVRRPAIERLSRILSGFSHATATHLHECPAGPSCWAVRALHRCAKLRNA